MRALFSSHRGRVEWVTWAHGSEFSKRCQTPELANLDKEGHPLVKLHMYFWYPEVSGQIIIPLLVTMVWEPKFKYILEDFNQKPHIYETETSL